MWDSRTDDFASGDFACDNGMDTTGSIDRMICIESIGADSAIAVDWSY